MPTVAVRGGEDWVELARWANEADAGVKAGPGALSMGERISLGAGRASRERAGRVQVGEGTTR